MFYCQVNVGINSLKNEIEKQMRSSYLEVPDVSFLIFPKAFFFFTNVVELTIYTLAIME